MWRATRRLLMCFVCKGRRCREQLHTSYVGEAKSLSCTIPRQRISGLIITVRNSAYLLL